MTNSSDCMLPGPPSRNNGGSADIVSTGLLAYAAGSTVPILDTRSMQLVSVFPIPPPAANPGTISTSSSTSMSPFVTSVRWCPTTLRLDLLSHDPTSSHSHLLLAAGDRQGRICLLDLRLKSCPLLFLQTDLNSKLGIQDLCWIQARSDSWIVAALTGPSLLSLYNTSTGRCFFRYEAAPELFSCIKRDPFDSRHLCAIGLKGFLLSIKVQGDVSESDVVLEEFQIATDASELNKLEREGGISVGSAGTVTNSPATALFPTYSVKLAFSPHWRHILYVIFPRELVVFDMQYETALSRASLPRGCGKFLDVLPDPSMELVFCAHLDGRLSAWRRKEGEQVHEMCMMEELVPSIGTSVPSPLVLAVAISRSNSTLQNVAKHFSDALHTSSSDKDFDMDFDNPFDFRDESHIISRTHLLSVTDDGKIWNWLLTSEGPTDNQKDMLDVANVTEVSKVPVLDPKSDTGASDDSLKDVAKQTDDVKIGKGYPSASTVSQDKLTLKISLVGQLHLLSSTVTVLAVPSPSLIATLASGGNHPAVAVPLVALGTQRGSIDLIDVSANAVAASFSVHDNVVRGLRWLGNTRLVSFSYSQGSEKSGGYVNRLVITCLRSGNNRTFRVLQKPERALIRALRVSSSGRYLLILFRDAPVEVWAMTKTPIMLRSLALPFTVLEWTLPTVPRPIHSATSKPSTVNSQDNTSVASDVSPTDSNGAQEDFTESFSFALVNGALGVFEVHGRRIRDFRPKWPDSSFVSSEGLVTAMAYRLPHVVMGDRLGNIRWWDVTTGQSSSFNTHREGIRRIKFSPVVPGDRSLGRIAVLFNDNTFSVFDLDSQDPLANSLLLTQFPGTLVLELDWLPVRTDKNDPLVLCIAGADSSFRLIQVNINDKKVGYGAQPGSVKERFRPMPLCSPVLLPTAHALALRLILQYGVKPRWFNTCSTITDKGNSQISRTLSSDLRSYLIDVSPIGDSVVPELLLKALEPYRREGCVLDDERVRQYANIITKGSAARFSFAAAIFGETSEACFWLQLPRALKHLLNMLANKSLQKLPVKLPSASIDDSSLLSRMFTKGRSVAGSTNKKLVSDGQLRMMAFDQEELWENASERITWHERLEGEQAIQNRVHELVSVGNLDAAVNLLLSTPPESSFFYPNALRAVALSSAVSRSLNELAVKVVAANMVRTDRSLSGTHLLCAVGRYQEACSQLQDAGCWTDAATLAATHLRGTDYARVMQRWAGHVLDAEHNIWRALILYVAAGSLQDALAALREAHQPDTAAMFIIACREVHAEFIEGLDPDDESSALIKDKLVVLHGLNPQSEDVIAVGELYTKYQQQLVHLCMDSPPYSD
ncbi:WD repeat-containing protein 11-like [Cynara cardunculus var. scolymus]|uniref:WD repeat-containing protein 11-like n=1 Tax=Cynara cardunculus var. scolymus TaxID=59895 RepID=UPI000D626485|nr:WD repeat-containing protein 11-like [Cynara cardunculus var. scolymus]